MGLDGVRSICTNAERAIVQEVNVSELRNHLPGYLARAESGEEFLVARRGRVVTRLSAAEHTRAAAKRQL
jgi:prevent-host-death family protein